MILYVISRRGLLTTGTEFSLPKNRLSPHGEQYWGNVTFYKSIDNTQKVGDDVESYIIEHVFEQIRLAEFNTMPSRFQSVFASNAEHFHVWQKKINSGNQYPVYKLEASPCPHLDAALLQAFGNMGNERLFEPSFARECARLYWSGKCVQEYSEFSNATSEMEYLVQYPFTVVNKLTEQEVCKLLGF